MAALGPKDEHAGENPQGDPTLQIARGLVEASYQEFMSKTNFHDLQTHQTQFQQVISSQQVLNSTQNNLERWKNIARKLQSVRETLQLIQKNMGPQTGYDNIPDKTKRALERLRHWCTHKFKTPDDYETFEGLYENTLRALIEQEGLFTNYFSAISQFCGNIRLELQKIQQADLNPDYLILIWSSYEHLLIQKVSKNRLGLEEDHHPLQRIREDSHTGATTQPITPIVENYQPPPMPPQMPHNDWQTQIGQGSRTLSHRKTNTPKEPVPSPQNIAMLDEIRQKATNIQTGFNGKDIEQHFKGARDEFASTKPVNPEQTLLSDIRRIGSASIKSNKTLDIEAKIEALKQAHLARQAQLPPLEDDPIDSQAVMLTQFQDAIAHRRPVFSSDDEGTSDDEEHSWDLSHDDPNEEKDDNDNAIPVDDLPNRLKKLNLS